MEFFHSEIPDALKSDPDGIRLLDWTVAPSLSLLMTFERGRAATGTFLDTVEYDIARS